jgi:S-adenosylmethionine-diacylglycerol 3-amino-3-carboxypropyl transferase
VRHGGQQRELGELLGYNRELAERLHVEDRVHTYGSFYIAQVAA